jgi:hypothetical protein
MPTCKIIITDEVNCKVADLDLDVRKRLVAKFKFEIPYAKHLPAVRLGRWDGKVPYFNLGGTTYVNLLPEILEWLGERNYSFDLEDNRTTHQFEFDPVIEESYSHVLWPKGHVAEGLPITLRDYQIEVINTFLENPQGIQEIATGAGKTIMTAALSQRVEKYGRSLIIVPNTSLVTQTEEDYRNMGLDVGVYYGDRKELNKTHTICTWQSLNNLDKKSKDAPEEKNRFSEFLQGVVAVIIDECFDGNSKVLTTTGYVPIKDIGPGHKIINYSESTNTFKEDLVVKQHKNLTKSDSEKMYELEFDNGNKIQVTGNHEFMTSIGWVRADMLTESHDIINKT